MKRSSRVFWATPAPVYTTPPESWDEARLNREWGFPVVDFAQWEVDFEADLACVREDALRFARFKEAQPLLRLDELRRIQARWAEERAAQPPPSRKAAKRARKAANVRAWRDGVRTDTEQLLQAKYTGINRAYGEATTRYKAAVEKLTAEKEAARAEAAATQKSSYNAQECVVCMDAPRRKWRCRASTFASAPSAPLDRAEMPDLQRRGDRVARRAYGVTEFAHGWIRACGLGKACGFGQIRGDGRVPGED